MPRKFQQAFLDPSLEAELISAFLQKNDSVISSDLKDSLEQNYFSTDSYRWIVSRLKESTDAPSKELIRIELEEQFDGDSLEVYKQQILSLYDRQLEFVPETVERFREYIAFQVVSSTIKSAFENRSRTGSKLWLREIKEGIDKAINVFEGNQLECVDFAEDYYNREDRRKNRRDNPELFTKLRLGIDDFDSQVNLCKGTVTGFLASFKRYKSIILNSVGFASILQGYNAAHIIAENTVELTSNRYDSMFSGLSYDRVTNYLKTKEEKEKLDEMMERIDNWPQRLKVIKVTPYKTTVEDVERLLDRLESQEGFVADVTIWDYLNLLAPSKYSSEERLRNEQVVWDLQNHAKCPGKEKVVITASQAKAEASEVDRIDASYQGKSVGISQGVDATIAINQTREEKRDGIIVLTPLFLRDGQITKEEIVLRSDISRMCVSQEMYDLWNEAEW